MLHRFIDLALETADASLSRICRSTKLKQISRCKFTATHFAAGQAYAFLQPVLCYKLPFVPVLRFAFRLQQCLNRSSVPSSLIDILLKYFEAELENVAAGKKSVRSSAF